MDIPDADVESEVERGRERYAGDQRLVAYFDSERGRSFIRSTLRRSRVVERLVDVLLGAHAEHPARPPRHDAEPSAVEGGQAQANAAIGATDPDAIPDATQEQTQTAEPPADEPATAG
jgi:hypothetical protein